MADQTNPFVMAGMMGMMMPNKYTDPAFKDKPLGLQGYYGTPTDAMGNPIQSFTDAQAQHDAWAAAHPAPPPGTTLNTPGGGLEAQGSQARAMQDAGYGDWAMLDPMMAQSSRPGATAGAGSVGATSGWNPANPSSAYPMSAGNQVDNADKGSRGNWTPTGQMIPGQTQQTQAPAQLQNPVDMRQAYLDRAVEPG